MSKKELFKYLIKEFHEMQLPDTFPRTLIIPQTSKIITLAGSRRAGKTFYFYHMIKELVGKVAKDRIIYLNFEDDRILPLDIKDLDLILEAYYELYPKNKDEKVYVFFDEMQNVPGWELYVRRIYDKEKVQLFITGSNSKLLSREIATSLRGRTLTFNIFPLSFKEFLMFHKIKTDSSVQYSKERFMIKNLLEKYLHFGGFPEVVLEKNNLEREILMNYYEIMIYKDIVERFSIRNTILLKEIAKFLLTNISSVFSINAYYNALKESTALSKETVFEYVSHLEEANLIFLVQLFDYSLKKQQVNSKKAYCIDTGLRNGICFRFSQDEGRIVENVVFIELKRRGNDVYYWKNKTEVDFIVKNSNQKITAINVSYADEINERETIGLLEFKREFDKTQELIIITKDTEKKEKGIFFVPLWKWLLN